MLAYFRVTLAWLLNSLVWLISIHPRGESEHHKARNGKIWIQTENRYKVIDGMVKTGFLKFFWQGCVDSKNLVPMSQFNVTLSIFLDSVAHSVQIWYMTFSCTSNIWCLKFWIRVRQIPQIYWILSKKISKKEISLDDIDEMVRLSSLWNFVCRLTFKKTFISQKFKKKWGLWETDYTIL